MNRLERLKKSIDYLIKNGYIHFQTDIAKKMDSHPQPVSRACNGDERYLTDKFLKRFNAAFNNIFNIEWLLTGEGEMLSSTAETTNMVNSRNTVQNNSTLTFGSAGIEKELMEQLTRKDEQIKAQAEQIKILLQLLGERK